MKESIAKVVRDYVRLEEETRALIAQAKADLYYGPGGPGGFDASDYPGFEKACRKIADALANVGELWVDTQSDSVCESEPEWTVTCELCEGAGFIEGDIAEDEDDCPECGGVGTLDGENQEDWMHLDRADVLKVIVGTELARYL